MLFVNKRSNVDRLTLHSISKPFELLHADIADSRFLAKSAVDPKYCLLIVDLSTSKIYVYPMKNRSLLVKKLNLFYNDIKNQRTGKMRLQADLEFNQNQIKILNDEFNVEMFHTKVRGRKAFAAEQKIREFKKILLRSKSFEKLRKNRIKPNDLIRKAAQNMNETISTKYNLAPETIEKRSLNPNDGKYFQEIYDFLRLRKIENSQMRNDNYDQKIDRRKTTLRTLLNLDEKNLVLAERLKKKDAPRNLYKASTENMPFFNRNRINYNNKFNDKFLRQELFAINKQCEKWIPALIYFKEVILKDNNKFTLDFSDKEFVEEVNFVNNLDYYITSLNCRLKVKEYIHDKDEQIKELSKKSRLLLEKASAYQNDIDYLTLKSEWYVKASNHAYRFMLWPKIIDHYSYKYKFWDTVEKKNQKLSNLFAIFSFYWKRF